MTTSIYEPPGGTHIATACKEAVAMAMNGRQNVQFTFNGVELLATPDSVAAKMEAEFITKLEADAKAYRESARGIAEAKRRADEVKQKQRRLTAALSDLPRLIGNQDHLMQWLKSFTEDADDIGVQFTKSRLADELEAAGYAENEHVGQKPEWFCTRERMAHYIVGQTINCLRRGMGPHPVTCGFVEKYFNIEL
jgi:hypothetical protein